MQFMQDEGFFQKHNIGDHLGGIFDDLPGFIYFVKDHKRRYVAFNRRLLKVFDATHPEEVLGKSDDDFLPPHIMKEICKDDIHILNTGETLVNKVELVPRGNGFVDWSTTNKRPLYSSNGDICGLVGVTRPFSQGTTSMTRNKELKNAIKLMHEHFRDNISVNKLADSVHLSLSSFLRKFKASFNMTPKEYLRHLKVQEACHKIVQTTMSFAEIAYECGFSDQSHFSREFSRIMKEAPTQYRARFKLR